MKASNLFNKDKKVVSEDNEEVMILKAWLSS